MDKTSTNSQKIEALLSKTNAYQRRPDDLVIKPNTDALKVSGRLLLSTKYGSIDYLGSVEKGIDYHGRTIKILSLQTLIELKRESTRPEDRQRLKILEETLDQRIEHDDDMDDFLTP